MHEVSNAINILNSSIDSKICKAGNAQNADGEKCIHGNSGSTSGEGLKKWFENASGGSGAYATEIKKTEQWGAHNAGIVSRDTAALTREEKGVVSSVFAKVIEGAGILWTHGCNVDNKICHKDNPYNWGVTNKEVEGKCGIAGGSNHNSSTAKGLSKLWEPSSASNGGGDSLIAISILRFVSKQVGTVLTRQRETRSMCSQRCY